MAGSSLLRTLVVTIGLISSSTVCADPKAGDDVPTKDEFVLKIENLVDSGLDLDLRRFTVLTQIGRTIKVNIGDAELRTRGRQLKEDPAQDRRLELTLSHRLIVGTDPKDTKIRRLAKFNRQDGGSIGTDKPAPRVESLAGVVQIKAKPGRYPIDKRIEIGTINGQLLVIEVE